LEWARTFLIFFFVVHRGYGALDQGDVHLVGELLGVHDGAVDHVDQLRQLEEPLVHVEKDI
jgi:gamma-glutamylcyclotransferase (GGCT)/AIG2-like uncharacterized protein YtfP